MSHEIEAPKSGGVKAALTRKVGPLPLWAYGAIVVVGVIALKLLAGRRGGSSSSAAGPLGPSMPGASTLSVPSDVPSGVSTPVSPPTSTGPLAVAPPISIPTRPAPSYVGPPSLIGKRAGVLAALDIGGPKAPALFRQISPSAVLDTSSPGGVVNPSNVLVGFLDPATGVLGTQPGPGRLAMWK